jgi:hypothetical protein
MRGRSGRESVGPGASRLHAQFLVARGCLYCGTGIANSPSSWCAGHMFPPSSAAGGKWSPAPGPSTRGVGAEVPSPVTVFSTPAAAGTASATASMSRSGPRPHRRRWQTACRRGNSKFARPDSLFPHLPWLPRVSFAPVSRMAGVIWALDSRLLPRRLRKSRDRNSLTSRPL